MTSKTSIMTYSGRTFDPLNPRADAVHLPDVDRGLTALRFGRHTRDLAKCDHPLSVRSHSMRVGRIMWWRRVAAGYGHDGVVIDALAGLLHDSGEGYCGDRLGPIKTEADEAMERAVRDAIIDSLTMPMTVRKYLRDAIESPWRMLADRIAASQEALIYQCGAEAWALPKVFAERDLIAGTLHLFHPRESDDWLTAVWYLARVGQDGFDMAKAAEMIGLGVP